MPDTIRPVPRTTCMFPYRKQDDRVMPGERQDRHWIGYITAPAILELSLHAACT